MQQININELKAHPQNEYFFDDIQGSKWDEFLDSVRTSGVIEPIVVTQDKIIVSGHQRIRACDELGIASVICEIRIYDDEDKVIKDLLETNIRQRGIIEGSAVKQGRRYLELERIYGISNGGGRGNQYTLNNCNINRITQSDLAKTNGISVDTWCNYKKLANLIPEIEELLNSNIIKPTTALMITSKMNLDEQYEFYNTFDKTQKITVSQINNHIKRIKNKQRKPIPSLTIKHLINRTNGKCEICDWGGLGLEGVLLPHHINKYSVTQNNNVDEIVMICPNCHGIIHTLENCKDDGMINKIIDNIDIEIKDKILDYVKILKIKQ